jgi:hypothetical protein
MRPEPLRCQRPDEKHASGVCNGYVVRLAKPARLRAMIRSSDDALDPDVVATCQKCGAVWMIDYVDRSTAAA